MTTYYYLLLLLLLLLHYYCYYYYDFHLDDDDCYYHHYHHDDCYYHDCCHLSDRPPPPHRTTQSSKSMMLNDSRGPLVELGSPSPSPLEIKSTDYLVQRAHKASVFHRDKTGGCSAKRSRRTEKRQPVKQTELCAFFAETGPDYSENRPELAICKE